MCEISIVAFIAVYIVGVVVGVWIGTNVSR